MHIPACETTELELIRFAPALEEANRPSPDYDSKRWLYVPNVYSEYRYILGTRGEHPLICIGINPSTACLLYTSLGAFLFENNALYIHLNAELVTVVQIKLPYDPSRNMYQVAGK